MKILWISRHTPLPAQLDWLKRRFFNVELVLDLPAPRHADEVCAYLRLHPVDDIIFIGPPLSILKNLGERGVKPLRSVMIPCDGDPHPDLEYEKVYTDGSVHRRSFRFVKFVRFEEFIEKTTEVGFCRIETTKKGQYA